MKRVILSLLLSIVLATPAFSQMKDMSMMNHSEEHGPMMGMGPMDKMGDMTGMCIEHQDKMGLSDAQVIKMKPVRNDMKKKQVRFKADRKIAEIELTEIMDVKDFDIEKARSAVKKIADITTAHHLEMLTSMQEMRAILTDDQFKKMNKMSSMNMHDKKPAKHMNKMKK
ncbi:MAG: hypothetical protein PHF56_18220 [Desulfuromonadaceae bacterium]|nr:hypothetical protein [Desulfuromonadaceae bacterium]